MQTTIKCFDQYHYLQYTKYYPVWKNQKMAKIYHAVWPHTQTFAELKFLFSV